MEVRVNIEFDGNHFWWPARLDRYDGGGITAATRTVPVIAVVDDPTNVQIGETDRDATPLPAPPILMRGAFVTIDIPIRPTHDLVRVPATALRPGNRLWIYDNGKLRVQDVRVTHSDNDSIILLADASAVTTGEQVIVSPLPLAVDKMELRRLTERTALDQNSGTESL